MGDCDHLCHRVEMVELDKFIKIFEGLTTAYGQTIKTDQFSEKGKHKTKSFTISNPVTKKLWREHLEGKDPIRVFISVASNGGVMNCLL